METQSENVFGSGKGFLWFDQKRVFDVAVVMVRGSSVNSWWCTLGELHYKNGLNDGIQNLHPHF